MQLCLCVPPPFLPLSLNFETQFQPYLTEMKVFSNLLHFYKFLEKTGDRDIHKCPEGGDFTGY